MSQDHSTAPLYFICYARADAHLVERIEAKLRSRQRRGQLRYWRDERNLDAGDEFTLEIERAIAEASGAILLVSDDFHASDYIQEHELKAILARAEEPNFMLFPLATTSLDDDDPLIERFQCVNEARREPLRHVDDADRDRVLTNLSDKLRAHAVTVMPLARVEHPAVSPVEPTQSQVPLPASATDLRPGLHGVPPLPRRYIPPRDVEVLAGQVRADSITAISGLRGEGGTGKTVLAAAVAHEVEDDFPAGVHWVTVGERATQEDVRRRQEDLLASLHAGPIDPVIDINDGQARLRAALADRQALVIIDDVWSAEQSVLFDAAMPGMPGRLLFTSRFADALPTGTRFTDVARLATQEAYRFLKAAADSLPDDVDDTMAVLEAADGLRMALAVLGATAREAGGWAPVLERLAGLADRFGSGDDASSAHKALHVAVDTLPDVDRQRLWHLAAFPPDSRIPISVLAPVWNMDLGEAAAFAVELAQRELGTVSATENHQAVGRDYGLELHDHVLDFLVLESPTHPEPIHRALWDRAQAIVHDGELRAVGEASGWDHLAEVDPYLWQQLLWHGARSGVDTAALIANVADTEWLTSRITRDGTAAAEQDLRMVSESAGLESEAPLSRLGRVLRHGGLFEDLGSRHNLRSSLTCWTGAPGATGTETHQAPRLHAGSLPVPSSGLVRTIRGHTAAVWGVAYSPDGTRLATASADGTARIWDPTTGHTLTELTGHTAAVWGVTYSPDGTHLATTSNDGTARIWDPATGTRLLVLGISASGAVDWHGDQLAIAAGRHWAIIDLGTEWR